MSASTVQPATTSKPEFDAAEPSRRVPELDGLRGIAILLVLICHYISASGTGHLPYLLRRLAQASSLGWSGVDLFFVLSGFLIGGILLESKGSPRYFQTFYMRRVFRILPVYYGWIVVYVFVLFARQFSISHGTVLQANLSSLPKYILFLQNFFYDKPHLE